MCGIFTYIWLIFMGNVGKYTIHGSYGIYYSFPYPNAPCMNHLPTITWKMTAFKRKCIGKSSLHGASGIPKTSKHPQVFPIRSIALVYLPTNFFKSWPEMISVNFSLEQVIQLISPNEVHASWNFNEMWANAPLNKHWFPFTTPYQTLILGLGGRLGGVGWPAIRFLRYFPNCIYPFFHNHGSGKLP